MLAGLRQARGSRRIELIGIIRRRYVRFWRSSRLAGQRLSAKLVELFVELVPDIRRVGMVSNIYNPERWAATSADRGGSS